MNISRLQKGSSDHNHVLLIMGDPDELKKKIREDSRPNPTVHSGDNLTGIEVLVTLKVEESTYPLSVVLVYYMPMGVLCLAKKSL